MAFRHYFASFILTLTIAAGVRAQNPDLGVIHVGTQGNRTDPTSYSFNGNLATTALFQLPFSAVVYSGIDGSEISKVDQIKVTCRSEFEGDGYTLVLTSTEDLAPAVTEGIVTYSVVSVGRAAVMRCYGISQGTALTCPATSNLTISQPQFCRQTSLSDPILITRTPPPVVSVCQRVHVIPSYSTTAYNGSFQVTLSEAVRGSVVTVTCRSVNPNTLTYCQQVGVTCCAISNTLTLGATTIAVGQTSATVVYSVSGPNQRSCVAVKCFATSASELPEGYFQFQRSTSEDASSEGLFESFTPRVTMEPHYLTVYNTSFRSVLYMDVDTNVDVPFQCQASVVDTIAQAQSRVLTPNCNFIFANASTTTTTAATTTTAIPTTTTTTLAPTTTDANVTVDPNATTVATSPPTTTPTTLPPTPPPDPSSPWITIDNSFTVKPSSKYGVVRTFRERLVIAPVQEIVVTTCCSVIPGNTLLSNLAVATVTVAQVQPLSNNTGGVTSGQSQNERFLVKAAYREVAPCPCDLTFQGCDLQCCCDGDCSDTERETFSGCIAGLPGGLDPAPDLRSCDSTHFPKDDWFPLMCVQTESNALLGRFYDNEAKLTTATSIKNRLQEQQGTDFSYREEELRFSDLAVTAGYTEGANILTVSSQGSAGSLPLPQATPSGRCLDSAPVHFLHDSQATCPLTLTPTTCADLTRFSARVYVQPSSLYNPACPRSYHVSADGRSTQESGQRAEVKVNYYCAGDVTGNPYLKDAGTTFSDLVAAGTVYEFGAGGLSGRNCSDEDLCGGDPACLAYNSGRGEGTMGVGTLSRCAFDSSFVLPAVPFYNTGTGQCDNVVLSVTYTLDWAGQTLTTLTADIVLGNVDLTPGQVEVSQQFKAVFVHQYSGASNQSDNFLQSTAPYQRSGRPGYDFGLPLATGCNATNATTGLADPVDQSEEKQMAVWSPGVDGLCQNARRRPLTFGDNVQSSCSLRLTIQSLGSCDDLKHLVYNHLSVLMPANVIGRYGYNDPSLEDMWVPILREYPFPAEPETTTPSPTTTPAAPSTTSVNGSANATTPIPTTTTPPTTTAATTTDGNVTVVVSVDPMSLVGGMCRGVVTGVHLEVMYAETGRSNGYPLREVVGAAVRFSTGNWSMSCTGAANSARCLNNSIATQLFPLTSSVQFTKVSANTPQKDILFYEIHRKDRCDSDTCYRFFEDFDQSVCHYDTCWHELLYPLTAGYPGWEGPLYTRAFSLLFCLFIIGYATVSKPWR